MEKKIISIEKLLQTPVCMMSGEELAFLFNNLGVLNRDKKPESSIPSPDRKLAYGIKGVIDVDLALELATAAKKEVEKYGK